MNSKTKKTIKSVLSVIIIVLALVVAYKNKDLLIDNEQSIDVTTTTTTAEAFDDTFDVVAEDDEISAEGLRVEESGEYTSKEEVAEYIHKFKHLPANYITKGDARELGWVSSEGNLWEVAPGKSIGGDYFGNNEGLLPEKKGRKYYECDIDFEGEYRNAKRIVYSNDGLVYYTDDHYESFEHLYGEE